MSTDYKVPGYLDLHCSNLGEAHKRWARLLGIYLKASGAVKKPNDVQVAIILNCAGPEVVELIDSFKFTQEQDRDNPTKVLEKLKEYCTPKSNEILESFRFWKLNYSTPFDSFATECRKQANLCNFLDCDRMLRDKIVFNVPHKLQEILLRENQLSLDKAIDICRNFETLQKSKNEMSKLETSAPVERVETTDRYKNPRKVEPAKRRENSGSQKKRYDSRDKSRRDDVVRRRDRDYDGAPRMVNCRFCGRNHRAAKSDCPAWGKRCTKCDKRNHFSSMCDTEVHQMSRDLSTKRDKSDDEDSEYDCERSDGCSSDDNDWYDADNEVGANAVIGEVNRRVTARMVINEKDVTFQLDTGADVNTITRKHVKKDQIIKSSQTLTVWNGEQVKPIGEATLEVLNPKTQSKFSVVFVVVPNNFSCLLGVKTVQDMNLLTIHKDNFVRKVDSGNSLGNLGIAKLYTSSDVKPKILPCRNIPIALRDSVKEELTNMEKRGIIVKENEPTPWVSQMAVVRKPNGKLRICIDPQPLNEALMREHYKLPTLDDMLPALNNAKVFTKLDVKEAFWHVELDEDSSRLTTMITPFARYRWRRLPFGLKVSSEIFQKRLIDALAGLEGVICVADDIIVVGCGDTAAEVTHDHDTKLAQLKQRCEERGIKLNDEKAVYRSEEIIFMGHKITKDGIKIDDNKVKAIKDMPTPTNPDDVKRFCGMVQYLSRFLPELADDAAPLRMLTRKDYVWDWSNDCQDAFDKIKRKISQAPVLAYYDPKKDLYLQVDSSQSGLGCALLQDGKPVEYASRSLTATERNWAQIEKELLSVVYGLEKFDQYTFGRKVVVENDHRPLFSILRKPLAQSPKRLQVLIMRLRRYDVDFQYMPGPQLYLADTLSRAYLESGECQIRVIQDEVYDDVPDKVITEVSRATAEDTSMQLLRDQIINGWPDRKGDIPEVIRVYFDVRDTLSYDRGVIRKGERVVIPESLRDKMKRRLHRAHSGHDSMMRRARQTVYWPSMEKDLKRVTDCCETCLKHKPQQQKEPLIPHSDGGAPWKKVGTDLLEYRGKTYLIVVDYFSGFIEVDHLSSVTSQSVITKLKAQFSRHGIPLTLISDNGPQYNCQSFKNFTDVWGINHNTSSPMYARSNGKAESAVKSVKSLFKKTEDDGSDFQLALLELRNTPRQDTGVSPSEAMFNRHTRSLLPQSNGNDRSHNISTQKKTRNGVVKKSHDKSAKELRPFKIGDHVLYKHKPEDTKWERGIIYELYDLRSYIIEGRDMARYRRNRVHIRAAPPKDDVAIEKKSTTHSGGTRHRHNDGRQTASNDRPRRSNIRTPAWHTDYTK